MSRFLTDVCRSAGLLALAFIAVGDFGAHTSPVRADEATQAAETPAEAPRPAATSSNGQKGSKASSKTAGVESKPSDSKNSEADKLRASVLEQHEKVERVIAARQGKPYQKQDPQGRVLTILDPVELGHIYDNTQEGSRYLVARLRILNLTDKPVTVHKKDTKLKLAAETLSQSELNPETQNASFSIGESYISLSDIKRPDTVTLEPGQAGETWVLYYGLELGATLPEAGIELLVEGQPRKLNLREQILGQLGFQSRRVGPSDSLAIFTISGRVNVASLSVIAEEIDKLVAANVSRLILNWEPGAPNVESNVAYFLFRYAVNSGRANNDHHDHRFPILPNALREIHLCKMPGSNYSGEDMKRVAHDELPAAIAAALWSALEKLPETELIAQIERGDPLVRPAALAAGSSRLPADRLAMVLGYLQNDSQPEMQKAALHALRHFGSQQAIEALTKVVQERKGDLWPLALASLTASRFEAARDAIDRLIADSSGESRHALLRELAKAPLPVWSDLFYQNAVDPESPIRVESLQALGRLGHEQLGTLLKQTLSDPQESVREASFHLILERRDPELESLLERIVLERLKSWPLDAGVQQYLNQTRNPKAIPYLLALLKDTKKDDGRRQALIRFLVEIGDDSVAEVLYGLYDDLSGYERGQVLAALQQMQSPRFMEVARKAIKSKDSSEIYAAINNLQMVDSRDAEALLIKMFEEQTEQNYMSNLANALAQIGSADAEKVLRKARKSDNPQRRQVAIQSLKYLLQRRPGYQYIYQAQNYLRQKQDKEALEMANAAIELDESLAAGYSLKGVIQLRLNDPKDARAAFEKAIALDDAQADARVGLLRVDLRTKELAPVLAEIDALRPQFETDYEFELQAALAYADAHRMVSGQPSSPEQQALLDKYATEALYILSQSVRYGMSDRQFLESAPELEPLAKHPDYAKALQGELEERKADETSATPAKETSSSNQPTIIRTSGVIMLPEPPLILE